MKKLTQECICLLKKKIFDATFDLDVAECDMLDAAETLERLQKRLKYHQRRLRQLTKTPKE